MEYIVILILKGMWSFFKASVLLSWNIFAFLYNNHIVRKTIRQVERDNIYNRDIDQYRIDIDHVFPNGFINNTLISGGERTLRTELLSSAIRNNSSPSVVIHCLNTTLSNNLFGINTVIVKSGSKNYDPFFLRSDDEILDMIIDSVPKKYHFEYNAADYIEGMLLFLRSKNIRPTLHKMATCPHSELVGNINAQISSGKIDGKLGRSIIMKLNSGKSEQSKINRYFKDLEKECEELLFDSKTGACNDIESAVSNGKNIILDIGSTSFPLLINLICCQIRNIKRNNPRISVVFDNVPLIISEDVVRDVIEDTNNGLVVSCDDVNALFHNDENLFNTFYSNCHDKLILRQNSGVSAKRFSDQIGTYKHKEIKKAIPETVFQLSNAIPFGVPLHHIIDEKDEPKVSENKLQNLSIDIAYSYDYSSGKWHEITIE